MINGEHWWRMKFGAARALPPCKAGMLVPLRRWQQHKRLEDSIPQNDDSQADQGRHADLHVSFERHFCVSVQPSNARDKALHVKTNCHHLTPSATMNHT